MVIRRTIVVLAVLLSVGMAWLIHTRLADNGDARHASFFDNAAAIRGAFQKALGPHPPVVELVIERDNSTALVVVGARATQHFTLSQTSGFVAAGPAADFPERDDTAFSMSTVPFGAVPAIVADGARALKAPPARLVIDREPGAKVLRFRVFDEGGDVSEVSVPHP